MQKYDRQRLHQRLETSSGNNDNIDQFINRILIEAKSNYGT